MIITSTILQKSLALSHFDEQHSQQARQLMIPMQTVSTRPPNSHNKARLGSVLILFYLHKGVTNLVLTRRRADMRTHPGQISFPGGGREGEESLAHTALREANEEIGLAIDKVTLLGELVPAYVPPSNFLVYPFVGWYVDEEKRPFFQRNPAEVAEIIEVPMQHLLDPAVRQKEQRQFNNVSFSMPYFAVGSHKIWGATASLLSEIVARLHCVIPSQAQHPISLPANP